MNINLIYQGNNYNLDVRKDINIKYIHDLASKLISKDITTFDLIYKNEILSDYQDSTLLKDLTKDDDNISIIISPKENNNLLSSKKIFQKLKALKLPKNSDNINKLKIMLSSRHNTSQKNTQKDTKINLFQNKETKITKEYISENKVFEDIYNSKENEIISLMSDLSQKIKEYDNVLYKNYKNKSERGNNELSLYEKIIIDFKNKQITFFKKLLNYFNNSEKDFISGELSLKEFFIDLKQYNDPNAINLNNNIFNKKNLNNNKENNKNNNINNNNNCNDNPKSKLAEYNNKPKIKLIESYFNDKPKIKLTKNDHSRNTHGEKQLPLIIDNKVRKRKNFSTGNNSTILYSDVINENYTEFNNEQKIQKVSQVININENENKNFKFIHNKSDTNDKIITNKKDNNNNINIIINSDIDSNNKKNILNKAMSISNINDNNSNTSNNISAKRKNEKEIVDNNEKKESNSNNIVPKEKSNQESEKLNKYTKFKSQKKIGILLEEPHNKQGNDNNDSSELSKSSSQKSFSRNPKKQLTRPDENIMFHKRKSTIKVTQRLKKKIGINAYDFII